MANTLNLGNGNWATKEDSLLAYNSENGNFKPLPFDFTRASSATVVNKAGLIETVGSGEPRIDFKDDAKGALLLEPTRSNLITYSEDFTTWSRSGWTLTSGLLSPNGGLDAYSVLRTTGSTFAQSLTLSANTTYTFTSYIKNVNATNIQLRVQNQAGNTSGTESNCIVFSVTDQTNDSDFTRITHTFNTGDAGSYGLFLGYYSAGEYIVWGAQLEQGSYATSYIPNFGNSAGATRSADVCNNGGNEQVINSSEGVLYAEISALSDDSTNRYISLSDGSTSNRVNIFFDSNNKLRGFYNGLSGSITISTNITLTNKIAFKYKSGDSSFWLNGFEVATRTDALSLSGLDSLSFDLGGGSDFYGNVKDVRVYNTALTDSELQALTKI